MGWCYEVIDESQFFITAILKSEFHDIEIDYIFLLTWKINKISCSKHFRMA